MTYFWIVIYTHYITYYQFNIICIFNKNCIAIIEVYLLTVIFIINFLQNGVL